MEHLMRPHSQGVYLPHDSSERPIQTQLEAHEVETERSEN
jgi:hypothetical protein